MSPALPSLQKPRFSLEPPERWATRFCIFLLAVLLAGGICVGAQEAPASKTGKREKPQISARQAEELFRRLDEVLQFVSDDTSLPIRHSIKKKLASRDEVEERARQQEKDEENAQRLKRSEVVLKKFRFVPQDFDLSAYMVRLLREQVAGFYSLKDKTVYMMDWIPEEQQMPIMSHELTHALQDQMVDLKSWLEHGPHYEEAAEKSKDKISSSSNVSSSIPSIPLNARCTFAATKNWYQRITSIVSDI